MCLTTGNVQEKFLNHEAWLDEISESGEGFVRAPERLSGWKVLFKSSAAVTGKCTASLEIHQKGTIPWLLAPALA